MFTNLGGSCTDSLIVLCNLSSKSDFTAKRKVSKVGVGGQSFGSGPCGNFRGLGGCGLTLPCNTKQAIAGL